MDGGVELDRVPALRTLGNIVTGDEEQTEMVVSQAQFWPSMSRLLANAAHVRSVKVELPILFEAQSATCACPGACQCGSSIGFLVTYCPCV